jgi:glutamyl-tRNA synthetase
MVKTRFCPSPTGEIHLGNARTALFCQLLAQHFQGVLLLRIEDTDKERSKHEHTLQLYDDLRWLGIHWQEGPEAQGDKGPYFQSQRQSIYDTYYKILTEKNYIYPCFCSNEQLEIQRKIQRTRGQAPRYNGTCRNLSTEQITEKKAKGLQPTYRFRVPLHSMIEFEDQVKGMQRFNSDDIGDFIIQRADGTPPFLYCNAIDDALMGVTHVLRGEDHLANTPRQLLILNALELPQPLYGHITMIVGNDGSPLSKRNGSHSIRELREQGFFSDAIINYLARLGHHYANSHFLSREELATLFEICHLGRAAARYDETQLMFWQKEALMKTSIETFWDWLLPATQALVPIEKKLAFIETIRGNVLFPPEAEQWAKIIFDPQLEFAPEISKILMDTGARYFELALLSLEQETLDLSAIFNAIKSELNLKGKPLFQPFRLALTACLHGPDLAQLIGLMGREEVIRRLQKIKGWFKG